MTAGPSEITLPTADGPLSALWSRPETGPARGTLVALHGGGMRAGYFHTRAAPGLSFLDLGARFGWEVLAVDRPGYGLSASWAPQGLPLPAQRELLLEALTSFPVAAGVVLAGHSYGG